MWILTIALLAVIFLLLKLAAGLKRQVDFYKNAEARTWTMLMSNVESKKMLLRWIEQCGQGKKLVSYFQKRGVKRIAIYGMAEVGELLYQMLKDTEIVVVCGVDQRVESGDLAVVKPAEFQEEVDAVVVTAVYYFSEIYDAMRPKVKEPAPILCLDEIIFELRGSENTAGL